MYKAHIYLDCGEFSYLLIYGLAIEYWFKDSFQTNLKTVSFQDEYDLTIENQKDIPRPFYYKFRYDPNLFPLWNIDKRLSWE